MEEKALEKPGVAASVWLLMGKGYRISRSIRLQWFFQHLNTIVTPKAPEEIIESSEELEVLEVLEDTDHPHGKSNEDTVNGDGVVDKKPKSLLILPTTHLSFVDRQYRFVYCIDMTPSMATVDSRTGEVLVDDMFNSIKNSLIGLVQPFCIGDSPLELSPRLYITVIAHTYTDDKECQVLMQGFCLNSRNITDFLCKLRRKLRELCDRLIHGIISSKNKEKPKGQKNQTSLFHMIRDSLLALFLLPNNASAAIVVVTDGVFILENAYVTEALLVQCRISTAVVSFLQVGTGYQRAGVELGYVPHCALMQFVATATSGAYLLQCPPINPNESNKMNIYHKSLLCWNFQRDVDRFKVMLSPEDMDMSDYLVMNNWTDGLSFSSDQLGDHLYHLSPQPQQTTNYMRNTLAIKISSLLSMRAREGYITDAVRFHVKQDVCKIEVKLVWPWKENVNIEYIAKATWPLDSVSNQTLVEVNVSGPYEFLKDIMAQQKPKSRKPLRKIVLQRFEHTMKSLEQADKLLVELHSFPYQASASKIPETIAKGSSVFCMTPNANAPVLTLQYGGVKIKKSSKSPEVIFANFWKPIVSMDTKIWPKWFHCHRISILMKHDRPIMKELFTPSPTGQYASIQCRAAANTFNKLLKDWCDFTLLENHTYVKFLTRSEKESPYSFCVLRLTLKGLCIIMRLAFLLGTPGIERSKVTEDFRKDLASLRAVIDRNAPREDFSSRKRNDGGEEPCIIFLNKQFERILVKYDTITDDIRNSGRVSSKLAIPEQTSEQENSQGSPRAVLGQYLFNQRWVWSMDINTFTSLNATSISQILKTVMKQRLHEGFNFCNFGQGIISLTKEVNVTVNSSEENLSNCCTIQYIMFPPHQKLLEKPTEDSTESDGGALQEYGDLQMVMEVWVEPQTGTVDLPNTPLSYIHGAEYNKIPEKIFSMDAKIVTEITSYLLLHKTCYDPVLKENMPKRGTPLPDIPTDTFHPSSVVQVPFLYELIPLIVKSSLVVSMYPMLICSNKDDHKENDTLLEYLSETLANMSDVKLDLNPNENAGILNHLLQRCNESKSLQSNPKAQFKALPDDEIRFDCYLKSFGSSLVITLLPSSVKDLKTLFGSQETSSIDTDRMILPFFIFECCFTTLQAVPTKTPDFDEDVLQDYTEALSESALIPRHLNQKLPESKSREINMFCQAVYDHYFWAMVSAVYECLKNKLPLDPEDVEFAIELFCEESAMEIDITMFLRILCNHYRSNTLIVDHLSTDDVIFPDHMMGPPQPENKPLSRLQKRSSSGSSSFKSSRTSVRIMNGECENAALANEIKKLFMEILSEYFQQVPENPYYLFFNDEQSERGSDFRLESVDLENEYETDSQDASSGQSSTTAFSQNASEYLNMSDNNLSSGPESDNIQDEGQDEEESEEKNRDRPMFLHLTCSAHYKAAEETILRSIPVTSLPTCLGDIFNQISDTASFDPYSPEMTITLDLICLSQPTEPVEDTEWKAPKEFLLKRQDSNDSFYSNRSGDSNTKQEQRQRLLSHVSREDSFIRQPSDSIEHIPVKQRTAIEKSRKDIEWLLEDEIASALRTQAPITEENLDRIANHIRTSSNSAKNCIFLKKYFNFVTGLGKVSNHCLPMFIVELESTSLDHRLRRIGKYYSMIGNSTYDDESDIEPGILEQVKMRAKVTRKGLGHRRSHSDFTSQRHEGIAAKVKFREKKRPRRRASSWPLFFDKVNADTNFIYGYGVDQQVMPTQHFSTRPFWDVGTDFDNDSEDMMSSRSQRSSTSKDSPFPYYEPRDLFQRSMSFSEYNKEKNASAKPRKRHYSLPNIYKASTTTDETLVPHDGIDGEEDEKASGIDENSVVSRSIQPKDRLDIESVMDEEQLSQPHPQFWLFMQITEEFVNIYFHHRQTEPPKSVQTLKNSYTRLLENMDQIFKIVNQRTLLDHMYETFEVNNLLIAEDEDKIWDESNVAQKDVVFLRTRESATTPFQSVIHGEYQFKPGFFECDMVWQHNIPIHNRLSASTQSGQSIAMKTVRGVLRTFQVHNRQNVFVIKEHDNDNIVYVRLSQVTNTNGRGSPLLDDDSVFRPVNEDPSRASSITSLAVNRDDGTVERVELERQDSYHSFQYPPSSKFEEGKASTSESVQSILPQEYISISVLGIREPGQEIKGDVINMITKKLDHHTLDLINQYISRNPKCKLTPKDVEFIQPPGKLPAKIIQMCVSDYGLKYLHAAMFYFHQQLLKKYNTPRYVFPDSAFHFKNYNGRFRNIAEPITSNNTYLYNRRDQKSEIGIGIIYVTLVDEEGRNVIAQPCYPALKMNRETPEELLETLEKILKFKRYDELVEEEEEGYARNFIVEISIWENGDINIEQLEEDLLSNFQYALLDVFMEFHVLNTPICEIPPRLHSSQQSSRRESAMQRRSSFTQRNGALSSASSSATTPKLGRVLVSQISVGKRSEPGTPVRPHSPSATPVSSRIEAEVATSFPKDYTGSMEESPMEPNMKRTPSTESSKLRDSPHGSTGRRESPAMRREGSFTKKETSPNIQRKLSGRDNSPFLRTRSTSSRTSSVRSESELTTSIDSSMLEDTPTQLPNTKVYTMEELNQMKVPNAAAFVLVTDAEVREAVGNGDKFKRTWQELEVQRRQEIDKSKERRNHEHGLVGDLHPTYFENVINVFEKILESGNSCMHKQEGTLHHFYSMEFVMQEFSKDIYEKSPDTIPKIFKGVDRMVDGVPTRSFCVYHERDGVKTKEQGETSMDHGHHHAYVSILPGQSQEYVVIGHNAHQWLMSMEADEDELSDDEEGLSNVEHHGKQSFKPLINSHSVSLNRSMNIEAEFPSCISLAFVPRQKFFVAFFKEKKVTLYTYNFTTEITTALDKQLKRLYAWHNVRTHLCACIFIQKLGLFQHKHFVRDCPDKEDNDVASFSSSSSRHHLLPLMKEVSPKARERNRGHTDNHPKGVPIPEFDELYRNVIPAKPLHKCPCLADKHVRKDVVKRQGWQAQEIRNIKLQSAYQGSRLREIYNVWKQEGAHVPVAEDKLHLLQRRSRFVHYCDAPILFKDYERCDRFSVKNILKTVDSIDKSLFAKEKDDWFQELKWALVQQYIQYLQTLGFCQVQIVNKNVSSKSNRSGHTHRSTPKIQNRSSDGKENSKPESRPEVFRLQKTTNGGIILMEVFFKRNNLCYKMSVFHVGIIEELTSFITERDERQFSEDINRYKDLTHLRSFTYDFHIREIQNHLSGRHSRFQKTYPVQQLMRLIIKEYPNPPRFCRCILAEGFISVPCSTDLTPSTVFNYFTLNSAVYDMTKIPVSKDATDLASSNVLTYSYSTEKEPIRFQESWRTRRDKTEYDGNVAIHYVASENVDVINLPFFIVMGNKKAFYPRPHMFSNVSSLKPQRVSSSKDSQMDGSDSLKHKSRVRFSGPNGSQEYVTEVQSAGNLRRLPSWNSNLADAPSQMSASIRNSESDSSLSSAKLLTSPKVSPGKATSGTVFKLSPEQRLSGGSPDSDGSLEYLKFQHPMNSAQENYLQNELKFVHQEILRVRDNLNNKVGRCLSNCWRDLLWHNLLMTGMKIDDDRKSKSKKISDVDTLNSGIVEWERAHLTEGFKEVLEMNNSCITYSTVKMLIRLVESFPLEKFENRISEAFTYVQAGMQQSVLRNLMVKFGQYCRKFVSDDGDNFYLCILNPNDLDMFYLVQAIESQGMMEFSVVYRTKPTATPIECKNEDELTQIEKNARRHIENVNTCLCYNLWMQLLPC